MTQEVPRFFFVPIKGAPGGWEVAMVYHRQGAYYAAFPGFDDDFGPYEAVPEPGWIEIPAPTP